MTKSLTTLGGELKILGGKVPPNSPTVLDNIKAQTK